MRDWSRWFVAGMVIIGVGIGVISLYTASMAGVMAKMGLVGADVGRMVEINELARRTRGVKTRYQCDIWSVVQQIPNYWLGRGERRLEVMQQMGEQRIECGIIYLKKGNTDRGIYTMVKGLHYLKNRYGGLRPLIEQNRQLCNLIGGQQYEAWVEAYLRASEGNAQQIVLKIYKEVEEERVRVEELCIE